MVGTPVMGVVIRMKKIAGQFRAANATGPDRATTTSVLGVDEGMAFRIMRRHDLLRAVEEPRLYLDEARWEAHVKRRRRIAFTILAIVLPAGILMFLWGLSR